MDPAECAYMGSLRHSISPYFPYEAREALDDRKRAIIAGCCGDALPRQLAVRMPHHFESYSLCLLCCHKQLGFALLNQHFGPLNLFIN